jgi:LysR family transcriptional regulator, low CO2-responsive transcriptional regulator
MPAKHSPPTPAFEPFDTRQLRILLMLGKEPSLSAAARSLHLTQSAISHALKKLEDDAGLRLVERNERGAVLTQAGQTLLRRVHNIFDQMRLAREEMRQLSSWGAQRLRFGGSSTACQYLLPAVLQRFSKSHPKCRVEVSAGDSQTSLRGLREGRIDLALVTHTEFEATDIELEPLFHETLTLVQPNSSERKGALPFIGYQRTSSLSQDAMQWFDKSDQARPTPTMELESLDAIKSMLILGQGYAVLPEWVVRKEIEDGTLESIASDAVVTRTWSWAKRRGHQMSLPETTWIKFCSEEGKRIVEGSTASA